MQALVPLLQHDTFSIVIKRTFNCLKSVILYILQPVTTYAKYQLFFHVLAVSHTC